MKQFIYLPVVLLIMATAFADETLKPEKPAILDKMKAREMSIVSLPLAPESAPAEAKSAEYKVGVEDILDISVLQPERISLTVTVSPDGSITFPYIGNIAAKDKTPEHIQQEIQSRLADGYMKYPVVSVSLKESRSRKFFVYGEVVKPGTYIMEDDTTVLRAISIAGGFTKYGSSSRVKVLRSHKDKFGYENIKINIGAAMSGSPKTDIPLNPGDIVVVSEGIF